MLSLEKNDNLLLCERFNHNLYYMQDRAHYSKHIEDYYDRQSKVYSAIYTGHGRYPTGFHRQKITLAMIEAIRPGPKRVLDAGCGDGRMVVELNKRHIPCTGFDISTGMLQVGKNLLRKVKLSPDLIGKGDIYTIPAKARSHDLLLSLGVLENLDRHDLIFQEFRRVLRSKGRIIISVENHLFSLFTFNQNTVRFLQRIFKDIRVPENVRRNVLREIASWLHLEDIDQLERIIEDRQIRREGVAIPEYDRLNVDSEFRKLGFATERIRFYHVHPLPPRFEKKFPKLFQGFAERLETSEYDWRSALLCNCMLVQAVKM